MFSGGGVWAAVPAGTLVLTYDDGPGPHTLKIADYLNAQGIQATFFVVGKYLHQSPGVADKLMSLGHSVGNHTDNHLTLKRLTSHPEELTEEVAACEREIQQLVGTGQYMLRAPGGGGGWSSEVAAILNRNAELKKYRGSFDWDIDCADYDIGRPSPNHQPEGLPYTLERCLKNYLQRIREKSSGDSFVA